MLKKLLILSFIILAFVLLFASCSSKLPQTNDFVCEFDTKNKIATITEYKGNEEKVDIPSSFGKYKVTAIGMGAFSDKYDITEITFPDTLQSIGASAFKLCISIKSVNLPRSLKTIGNAAFSDCRGLTEITIPENVESIGICAFTGCTSLEKITVDNNNKYYLSDSYGALLTKDESTLLQFPTGSKRPAYVMPEKVTVISSYCFEKSQYLKDITFSPSLKKIEGYAFQASGIIAASFGNALEEIGPFAFNEARLITLELGSSVKKIEDSAFSWCTSLREINIPASLTEIGRLAFYMCSSVTKYTVDIQNPAYSSDDFGTLFDKNKTLLINHPSANTMTEYSVPETAITIMPYAFSSNLNLEKVIISDSVTTIEEGAFAYCANLSEILYNGTTPENIASDAFKK